MRDMVPELGIRPSSTFMVVINLLRLRGGSASQRAKLLPMLVWIRKAHMGVTFGPCPLVHAMPT